MASGNTVPLDVCDLCEMPLAGALPENMHAFRVHKDPFVEPKDVREGKVISVPPNTIGKI